MTNGYHEQPREGRSATTQASQQPLAESSKQGSNTGEPAIGNVQKTVTVQDDGGEDD